jgi:glycosyltransferase involved in cell wall biosynthesis
MAVRDGEAHLNEAIASIRAQSFCDWELLVVDDGSDDGTLTALKDVASSDARIRVFRQEKLGLVAALNRAVGEARGDLFARMDADDRAHPARLERQVCFLGLHRDVGVVGTPVRRFGAATGVWLRPLSDADIRAALLFEAPLAHPTVMFRRSLWESAAGEGYREDFRAAEDIDLWERLASYTRFANLAEPLLDYRVHAKQVTQTASAAMAKNGARVRMRWLQRIGVLPSDREMECHEAVAWLRAGTREQLQAAGCWLGRIPLANVTSGVLNPDSLAAVLERRWFEYASAHSRLGFRAWRTWRQVTFRRGEIPALRVLRFALICALRQTAAGRAR